MATKGTNLRGALKTDPRGGRVTSLPVGKPPMPSPGVVQAIGAGAGLQRLSPGVYRNQQGQLVNSRGGNLPGQKPMQPQMPSKQPNYRVPATPMGGQQPQSPQNYPAWQAGQVAQNEFNQPQQQRPAPTQDQWMSNMLAKYPNDPAFNGGTMSFEMGMPKDNQGFGNKPFIGPMTGNFTPEQMNSLYQSFQQQQMPGSVSGMLQQGGQPQPPMMPNSGAQNFTPEMNMQQWKQMQMGAPQPMSQAYQRFAPYKG